ncbi:MAG: hypothetical protein JF618_05580 [Leifsonia sp.]|nr:hypothetical protein [Leifsonia sp.]
MSAVVDGDALDVMDVGPDALPQPQRRLTVGTPEDVLEFRVALADLEVLLGDGTPTMEVLAGRKDFVERFRRTFRFDPIPGEDATAQSSAA